jgi:hypothetical protein
MSGTIPMDIAVWGGVQLVAITALWVRNEVASRLRHKANVMRLDDLKEAMAEDRKKFLLREVAEGAMESANREHQRIHDRIDLHETRIGGLEGRVSRVEARRGG